MCTQHVSCVSLQPITADIGTQRTNQWDGAWGQTGMIFRGPGFLAVLWYGSYPTPLPSLSSTTDRLRKKDNLLTGEGMREEPKITQLRKAWFSIHHSIISGDRVVTWQKNLKKQKREKESMLRDPPALRGSGSLFDPMGNQSEEEKHVTWQNLTNRTQCGDVWDRPFHIEEDNLCKRGRGVKVATQINYIREGVIPTYLQGRYPTCTAGLKGNYRWCFSPPKLDVRFVQI